MIRYSTWRSCMLTCMKLVQHPVPMVQKAGLAGIVKLVRYYDRMER